MKHEIDYLQPDFFRFGWDQLFFVDVIRTHSRHQQVTSLVELGAGSGVIACELSRKLAIQHVHLVEYQQSEWEPFIRHNITHFGKFSDSSFHWLKVSEFNRSQEIQAPLVVCNPPYFLPRAGRNSLDPRRNIAHRFVIDQWQDWVDAMVRTLAPGGEAWWLHRDPGPMGKPKFPENFDWKHVVRSGRMRVIRLARLDVE